MATLYASPNPTAANDTVRNRMTATAAAGSIRHFESVYTITGAEVTADVIVVAELPVGAVVIPELSIVAQEASLGGGTNAIGKIGDSTDDDRYSATSITLSTTAAGVTAVTAAVATSVIPRFTITATTQEVLATFTFVTIPTTGKKILFRIAYRLGH
jgi:preprotein translocase subunit Sec61beta